MSFRVASLIPGQSYDCPSASVITLKDMGKICMTSLQWKNRPRTLCIMLFCLRRGILQSSLYSALTTEIMVNLYWQLLCQNNIALMGTSIYHVMATTANTHVVVTIILLYTQTIVFCFDLYIYYWPIDGSYRCHSWLLHCHRGNHTIGLP